MSLSNDYNVYVETIISLTRSFVIKHSQTINQINNILTGMGDTLSLDQHNWKYYRNIAGLPYIGNSGNNNDPDIAIHSLDTNGLINFTPSILINHPLTLADLKTYGNTFKTLLSKYPTQDLLIRGVITPVDINKAIAADNYTILGYDETLVQSNESNLIPKLQKWINNFTSRYGITSYSITDNLYTASSYGILILLIVGEIITIRKENCNTQYVHAYHVWSFLGGYFNIDEYKPYISFDQALFLYRNIDYLIANAGTKETLDFLNSGFAQPFGLELYSFNIRQSLGESLKNLKEGSYSKINNVLVVEKYPYGNTNYAAQPTQTLSVPSFVNLLQNQAPENINRIENDIDTLLNIVNKTTNTNIPTGVIECSIKETAAVNLVNNDQERVYNWLYLTANGFVKYKYELNVPTDNIDNLMLSSEDAAVFLMYASLAYFTHKPTMIDKFTVSEVMVPPAISENTIRGLVQDLVLKGNTQTTPPVTWDRYNQVLSMQVTPIELLTLSDFNTYIKTVVSSKINQFILPFYESSSLGRSELKNLVSVFFQNVDCSFVTETTYSAFFNRIGVDYLNISPSGLLTVINAIYKNFIGIDPESSFLQHPYTDMVDILTKLCNYNLTFVKGLPTNNIVPLEWAFTNLNTEVYPSESTNLVSIDGNNVIKSNIKIELGTNNTVVEASNTSKLSVDFTSRETLANEINLLPGINMTYNEDKKIPMNLISSITLTSPVTPASSFTCSVLVNTNLLGLVNKKLLGNSVEWTDNGDGIVDNNGSIISSVFNVLSPLTIGSLRYPGGTLSDSFHWADSIGPISSRGYDKNLANNTQKVIFGFNEFLNLSQTFNADPLITINVPSGTSAEAAGWVDYADQKHAAGLPMVSYWEVGNEPYIKQTNRPDLWITPSNFISKFNSFIPAMKAVNSNIKVGLPMRVDSINGIPLSAYANYNTTVLSGLTQPIDFLALHYYLPYTSNGSYTDEQLFLAAMAASNTLNTDINNSVALAHSYLGVNVPVAVTEFNALFTLNNVNTNSYIQSLMGALLIVDMVSVFINNSNVIFANFWSLLGNYYFGLIDQGFNPRPSYYAMKMLSKLMQGNEINNTITAPTFSNPSIGTVASTNTPLITSITTRNNNTTRVLIINKSKTDIAKATILVDTTTGDTWVNHTATITTLTGSTPLAGIPGQPNINYLTTTMNISSNSFVYSIPPFSLILFEISPNH